MPHESYAFISLIYRSKYWVLGHRHRHRPPAGAQLPCSGSGVWACAALQSQSRRFEYLGVETSGGQRNATSGLLCESVRRPWPARESARRAHTPLHCRLQAAESGCTLVHGSPFAPPVRVPIVQRKPCIPMPRRSFKKSSDDPRSSRGVRCPAAVRHQVRAPREVTQSRGHWRARAVSTAWSTRPP